MCSFFAHIVDYNADNVDDGVVWYNTMRKHVYLN